MSHTEEFIHAYLHEVPASLPELRKQLKELIKAVHNETVTPEQQKMLDELNRREGLLPLKGNEKNLLN